MTDCIPDLVSAPLFAVVTKTGVFVMGPITATCILDIFTVVESGVNVVGPFRFELGADVFVSFKVELGAGVFVPFVEGEPDCPVVFCNVVFEGAGVVTDVFRRSTMTKRNKGIIMIR